MDSVFPSRYVEKLIDDLAQLPSVGRRTALRLSLYILKNSPDYPMQLMESLKNVVDNVKYCKICHNICDDDICPVCSSHKRDNSMLCVIENVRDFIAIEETNQFNGLYHLLGGVISPLNGIGVEDLNINSLLTRINDNKEIKEIIFALPTTVEGETTSLYLYKLLSNRGLSINTIARGVAFGDELEYTDQITLGRSIVNRVAYQIQK